MAINIGSNGLSNCKYGSSQISKICKGLEVLWENWKHNPKGVISKSTDVGATSGGYCEVYISFDKPTKVKQITWSAWNAGGSYSNMGIQVGFWPTTSGKGDSTTAMSISGSGGTLNFPDSLNDVELGCIFAWYTNKDIAHGLTIKVTDYYQRGI